MVKIPGWRIAAVALAAISGGLIIFLRGVSAGDAERPRPVSSSPRVLGRVPQFKLTDQSGNAFGTRQLQGRCWLANFVFTRCAATCPMQTVRMSQLQKQLAKLNLGNDTYLVSFSVDPGHDTPEVLARYANRNEANKPQWRFLTGARDEIWKLSKEGFKLGVGQDTSGPDNPLFHSAKLVLVDHEGHIRGYFDGLTTQGIASAHRALQAVRMEVAAGSTPPE